MGLIDIPPGQIGTVVTYLEMRERSKPRPSPMSPLRIARWEEIDPAKYRILFRRIGERWLWYSRLVMDDAALMSKIGEVHAVIDPAGVEVGMIELTFAHSECQIEFLGLIPELAGKGHGNWLFAQTLGLAWRRNINRVTVNTCTLDHPAALKAYLSVGFRAYKQAFESFPDPRLLGLLPRGVAPQIPLINPLAS